MLKIFLFWLMIQCVVGVGSALVVANMWSWIEKLPVFPSFNIKKWLLAFKYADNKPKEIFFVAGIMTLIAMGIGSLLFR